MNTINVSEVDQAGAYYPSSYNVVQVSGRASTVKLSEGDHANLILLQTTSTRDLVRAIAHPLSRDTRRPSRRRSNTGFCFIATYHNFAEDETDFDWLYNSDGKLMTGQIGRVANLIVISLSACWRRALQNPMINSVTVGWILSMSPTKLGMQCDAD